MQELQEFLERSAELVNAELDRLVPPADGPAGELCEAMRWSLFGGGKRFRPALVLAVGRSCGSGDDKLLGTAAAVEMIHTYSLIHDDLPAMDNDELRRGRATSHKQFGEATAILAGDALQALAFQTIAEDERIGESVRLRLLRGLGDAAAAMVSGQFLDLEAEGQEISTEELRAIHRNKTGALIEFSAVAGAIIGGVNDREENRIREYGRSVGLLFQIVDDILDVTGSTEALGKTAGKDVAAEKATYPAVVGLEEAEAYAAEICEQAKMAAAGSSGDAGLLGAIPDYLLSRRA
jgi:geranylgeranyl pyrophosphate synthase